MRIKLGKPYILLRIIFELQIHRTDKGSLCQELEEMVWTLVLAETGLWSRGIKSGREGRGRRAV